MESEDGMRKYKEKVPNAERQDRNCRLFYKMWPKILLLPITLAPVYDRAVVPNADQAPDDVLVGIPWDPDL